MYNQNQDMFKNIKNEWKLTSYDAKTDFAITTMMRYFQQNPYAEFNYQTILDISRRLLSRIIEGMKELKKEDGLECLEDIIVHYINYDILQEAKHRRLLREMEAELEKSGRKNNQKQGSQHSDITESTNGGMYV